MKWYHKLIFPRAAKRFEQLKKQHPTAEVTFEDGIIFVFYRLNSLSKEELLEILQDRVSKKIVTTVTLTGEAQSTSH